MGVTYDRNALAQGFQNIASMYAPPSAQDLQSYAAAGLGNQKRQQLDWLFANATDPTASARSSLIGVQGYGDTPAGFMATDATKRYGIDTQAATDVTVGAGHDKANMFGTLYSPLNPGQVRPAVPENEAAMFGLPGMIGPAGAPPAPLSLDEWKAQQAQRMQATGALPDSALVGAITGAKDQPTSVQEYQFAVQNGYTGSYDQFLTERAKAGASTTQVGPDGKIGQVPSGYAVVADPTVPGGLRMAPIPGGPADKSGERANSTSISTDTITNAADKAAELDQNRMVGGTAGAYANKFLPGSTNAALYREVDVLKSIASIESLTAMRQASPTGGALGSVTQQEEAMLAAKAGALDPASATFQNDLRDYELTLLRIVHGKDAGDAIYAQKYGGLPDWAQSGAAPVAPAAPAAPANDGIPTVSTPEEAAKLPKGTKFRDPTGAIRVVP